MLYLSAQPDNDYFLWQLQVQFNNFERMGIPLSNVYALVAYRGEQSTPQFIQYANETKANILFYKDEIPDRKYIPSIRPHIIKKFFKENPELSHEYFFYHDSDILFTRVPNWEDLSDGNWKVSDTVGYIGYEYIIEKGSNVLLDMCDIVKIPPKVVRNNQKYSGGCQYLLIGTNYSFWDKVERDCEGLYSTLQNNVNEYGVSWSRTSGRPKEEYHPIQEWCSDMWAVLWNAWLIGYKTDVADELSFSWATNDMKELSKHNIFHNAGVVSEQKNHLFFKGDYITQLPYHFDLNFVNKNYCSYYYVQEIENTKIKLGLSPARNKTKSRNYSNPKVSCVMTTYGRFSTVERSIGFWLKQDYKNKELIILNTAPVPLTLSDELEDCGIKIINQSCETGTNIPYTNVGKIREDALRYSTGDIYICWDDDDMFLPFHIKNGVRHLIECGKDAWMPKRSMFTGNGGDSFMYAQNAFEASVLVWIDAIWRYGFLYENGSEHLSWRRGLVDDDQLDENFDVNPLESYVYIWGEKESTHKQSGDIDNPNNFENHKAQSIDFGDRPLGIYDDRKLEEWYMKIVNFVQHPYFNKHIQPYLKYNTVYSDNS